MTVATTPDLSLGPEIGPFPSDRVVDLADVGVVVLDSPGVVVCWNGWMVRHSGISADSAIGRTLTDIFGHTLSLRLVSAVRDCVDHAQSHILSPSLNRQLFPLATRYDGLGGGAGVEQTVTIKPIWGRDTARYCLIQITDVSLSARRERFLRRQANELSSLIEELKIAKDIATRANSAKSEFLTDMSHELRSPLNAIIGFSQLLQLKQSGALTEEQMEFVTYIRKAGEHLLKMISDILDLSRIEAKNVVLDIDDVEVDHFILDTIKSVSLLGQSRHIVVHYAPSAAGALTVRADRTRLAQIVLNLLSNAIKYNKTGGQVTVWAEVPAPDWIRIAVADTGGGIPLARQSELFQSFNRLGAEFSEVEGAGIGLALSRKLAELMGGTMGFESRPGDGSTFWVEMPTAGAGSPADAGCGDDIRPASVLALPPLRLLYIEDNPVDLRLVKGLVRTVPGASLVTARTGEDGVRLARETMPDVILMDIRLPGINGFEALRRLGADAITQPLPVVAVSASALSDDIARGLAAGFRAWLTKPLDIARLLKVLADLTGSAAGPSRTNASEREL